MKSFVLDCSVTMAWCFEDEEAEYPLHVLEALKSKRAIVPTVWPLEVVNVLAVAERRKRITEADSGRFLTLLSSLPIEVTQTRQPSLPALLSVARQTQAPAYDATYLELCVREGLALAALDQGLLKAAKRLGVKIFPG